MNSTGWCASNTTQASSTMCTATTVQGILLWSVGAAAVCCKCLRMNQVARLAFSSTAKAAFQPKCCAMKALSQPQALATISTGGAAYDVSVPPIDTLTNSTPSARYL